MSRAGEFSQMATHPVINPILQCKPYSFLYVLTAVLSSVTRTLDHLPLTRSLLRGCLRDVTQHSHESVSLWGALRDTPKDVCKGDQLTRSIFISLQIILHIFLPSMTRTTSSLPDKPKQCTAVQNI